MPVWAATALAVFGASTPVIGFLWGVLRKLSYNNQHFDPNSPVGQAIGTIPQRLDGLSHKIEQGDAAIVDRIATLEEHVRAVTVWKPTVESHQRRQDGRLHALEVFRATDP